MGNGTNQPESIIFFLDIMGDLLSKKDLSKNLEIFMKEKQLKNPQTMFTLFYFIEDPNTNNQDPIYSEDIKEPKDIARCIEEKWKLRRKTESFFENGLFFCVSKLAEKVIKKSANYRILVISDTPSKKDAQYADALMNLVETVRNFPTFIDIIRVGHSRFYPDDVKLRIITTITAGGLFYCENDKELQQTLIGLVKNKTMPNLMPSGGQIIDNDKKNYYERLALVLVPLTSEDTPNCRLCTSPGCNFCNSQDDHPKKCPNCGKQFHECCAALYSWKSNIGLKHIFRCPECDVLIKLDEVIVARINGEPLEIKPSENEEKQPLMEKITPTSPSQETWTPPKEETINENTTDSPALQNSNAPEEKKEAAIKQMGLFGPRIIVKKTTTQPTSQNNDTPKILDPSLIQENASPQEKSQGESLAALRERRRRMQTNVIVCPVCSAYLKATDKICPKCNTPIKL